MSPSAEKNISGFIKTKGRNQFLLTESSTPEVMIIDIDNAEGKQLLKQHHHDDMHIISLSLSEQLDTSSSITQIKKPITSIELLLAAEKIKQKIKFKDIKSNEKGNSSISNILIDEASYDPSDTLQGMLNKTIRLSNDSKSPFTIAIQQYQIIIDAEKKTASFNFSKHRLRDLCHISLNDRTCQIKKSEIETEESLVDWSKISLTELSWSIALSCSRGRLPRNINSNKQYQLKAWPNLTRWENPENAIRIASLWSKQASTINSIVQQLSISSSSVHSFITAAIECNLATTCDDSSDVATFESENKNTAFFSKFLSRLKRA